MTEGAIEDGGASADAGKQSATLTAMRPPTAADAGAAGSGGDAVTLLGSPLCNVFPGSVCNPDSPGCSQACAAEVLGDASTGGCDDGFAFACHVTPVRGDAGMAAVVPACSQPPSSHHLGSAEEACTSSASCAIGFECVIDDTTEVTASGVCRHYCCDNTCAAAGSFCDIETVVGGALAVPVCVAPQAPCQLLKDSCPAGLTCQIVDQATGLAACDKPGSATAGQSCETQKCAKGFSCIGEFPNRQCAQLCNVNEPGSCLTGTCTQNTVLANNDSAVGICAQ